MGSAEQLTALGHRDYPSDVGGAPASRLHAALGVAPLSAYAVFHVWEMAAAVEGREAFVSRASGELRTLASAVVVGLVLAHALLGLRRRTSEKARPEYGSRGERRLQLIAGVLAGLFLVGHLAHTTLRRWAGADAAALYEHLRHDLARVPYVVLYVVGLAFFSLHLAQGLSAAAIRSQAGARRVLVVGSYALAVLLFVVSVNTLGHFAAGAGLFWSGAP